jgi:hypothetical protein
VLSAEKFYDYADEHFGWAETARTERERAIFFQMAAAWLLRSLKGGKKLPQPRSLVTAYRRLGAGQHIADGHCVPCPPRAV